MSTTSERQRFLKTLAGGGRDDVPRHERFIREEVVESWRQQGLAEAAAAELLALDRWQTGGLGGPPALELRARPPL
ncbi:MAG: hypothetical protein HUU35_17285, partial [Armatimonadetes bacterium]|nr:hypothetical protein [Armatimonadota bacterium]